MIQILHFIDGKMCFVKERGIPSVRPMDILELLPLEVMSVSIDNADSAGDHNATK